MSDLEVRDRVFSPGNLVHGTWRTVFELSSYFTKGIQPGQDVGNGIYTPELICLSLLGSEDLPNRYLTSNHFGPRWQNEGYSADNIKVAFIISREKLLSLYPEQTFAVGRSFWDHSFWNRIRYGKKLGFSVYDIPVKHPGSSTVFRDEVRVYPSRKSTDKRDLVIPPDTYRGMVALPSFAPYFFEKMSEINVGLPLPVFSPQCELLGYAGAA